VECDPAQLSSRDAYKLLTGSVLPRPIALVSTVGPDGQPNVSPFSYFQAISARPMVISFCPNLREGEGTEKDTLRNIRCSGEFVVGVVTEENLRMANEASAEVAPDVNEFQLAGFTPAPAARVRAPRVAESPISLECRLLHLLSFGNGPGAGRLVIGEVVHAYVRDDLYQDGRIDFLRMGPVGRMAGNWYCRTGDVFELPRPPAVKRHP
jgi:flavin reductase (DIM6/NTAB) family NADH-FMN oxidoreductase RutF